MPGQGGIRTVAIAGDSTTTDSSLSGLSGANGGTGGQGPPAGFTGGPPQG